MALREQPGIILRYGRKHIGEFLHSALRKQLRPRDLKLAKFISSGFEIGNVLNLVANKIRKIQLLPLIAIIFESIVSKIRDGQCGAREESEHEKEARAQAG